MQPFTLGPLRVRPATTPRDMAALDRLRVGRFRAGRAGSDRDAADADCLHVMVEDGIGGALWGSFRARVVDGAAALARSYSAGYYDLSALAGFGAPMVEVGRFCVDAPAGARHDVLRAAFAALAGIVEAHDAGLMFGCTSFFGTDPSAHAAAFTYLDAHHRAPARWRPGRAARRIVPLRGVAARPGHADRATALGCMPPLMRHYLSLGGWVSDHAVIDEDLGTIHVFTGVEVAAIPAGRAATLRRLVAAARPVPGVAPARSAS